MSFSVYSKIGRATLSIDELVGSKVHRTLSLPGVGAIQRAALRPGCTGEITRLNHHVTFVTSGSTRLRSRHDGEPINDHNIGHGAIHVRPALVPHVSEWNADVELTVIAIEPRFFREQGADLFRRDTVHLSPTARIGFKDAFLWQLGTKLDALVASPTPPTVFFEQLFGCMAMHLALTVDKGSIRPPARALSRAALNRVRDYVEANLRAELRLIDLARLSNLSAYHFSRQFSRETGIGVGRYIQLRRMARAADLLSGGGLDVADVGEAVGYVDASSFARAFRTVYGVSPQAYRRGLP
jgi:AraC family transcriptional regulator